MTSHRRTDWLVVGGEQIVQSITRY